MPSTLRHDRRAAGKQKPERERHAQHPLPHRLMRQDFIHQQGRTLDHMPRPATGAKVRTFTTECQQVFGMAGVAAHPQKAVFKTGFSCNGIPQEFRFRKSARLLLRVMLLLTEQSYSKYCAARLSASSGLSCTSIELSSSVAKYYP